MTNISKALTFDDDKEEKPAASTPTRQNDPTSSPMKMTPQENGMADPNNNADDNNNLGAIMHDQNTMKESSGNYNMDLHVP